MRALAFTPCLGGSFCFHVRFLLWLGLVAVGGLVRVASVGRGFVCRFPGCRGFVRAAALRLRVGLLRAVVLLFVGPGLGGLAPGFGFLRPSPAPLLPEQPTNNQDRPDQYRPVICEEEVLNGDGQLLDHLALYPALRAG